MLSWLKNKKERLIISLIILAVVLVSIAPLLYGYFIAGPQDHFLGAPYQLAADYPVYLSMIEQGRQGNLVMKNLYTPELQNPSLISPLWLLLGLVGRVTNWSNVFLFHLARVIAAIFFLYFLYFFVSCFFQKFQSRLMVFVLLIFSSGLGSFFLPGENVWDVSVIFLKTPTDFWVSESNTFLTIYHSALFILSQLLVVTIFYLFINRLSNRRILVLVLLSLILGIFHPYDLVTIYAVLFVYLVFNFATDNKEWHKIKAYLPMVFVSSLALVYYYVITKSEIAIGGWSTQNYNISPPLFAYITGYGLVLFLAILGTFWVIRGKKDQFYFLVIWFLTSAFLLYAPIAFQRRLSSGLHIPLALLAGLAIEKIWLETKHHFVWRSVLAWIFIPLLFLSNIAVINQDIHNYNQRDYPYFFPQEYYQSFLWLKDNVDPAEVTLASPSIGNLIPAFAGRTVYAGHGHQTVTYAAKIQELSSQLMVSNTSDQERFGFFKKYQIEYFWYSDREKMISQFDPAAASYLEQIYSNSQVEIYRVKDTYSPAGCGCQKY
ncbi:MAG: hypothetical protein WC480_01175 [Patescibacteria group bacterium]